jgi:cell division protein FtsQ
MGDDADIDGKISTLKDILKAQPQLMEMEGVLMLENYTESNSRKEITFKRK